jgi:hypothetical protein
MVAFQRLNTGYYLVCVCCGQRPTCLLHDPFLLSQKLVGAPLLATLPLVVQVGYLGFVATWTIDLILVFTQPPRLKVANAWVKVSSMIQIKFAERFE